MLSWLPTKYIPKEFIDVEMAAYEISEESIDQLEPATAPPTAITKTGGGSGGGVQPFPFFSIIAILWFIPLFRRRRTR